MALEDEFGRHRAEVKTLAGVYGAAYEGDEDFAAIQKSVEEFAEEGVARFERLPERRAPEPEPERAHRAPTPVLPSAEVAPSADTPDLEAVRR